MDLAVFHQCYNEYRATEFALEQFKQHNPDYQYFLVSDGGPDFSDLANKHNAIYSTEPNLTMNVMGTNAAQNTLDRIRKYCMLAQTQYLLIMEDDVWCRGRIDFDYEFNALGTNSPMNKYYQGALDYIAEKYQVTIKNSYYNLCGGSILNTKIFIDNYDRLCDYIKYDHNAVRAICKDRTHGYEYGGWDSVFNMLYNICELEVGVNPELTETFRDVDWRTNGKKLVHWYKENYINGEGFRKYYL
jgi:hypothetical protein